MPTKVDYVLAEAEKAQAGRHHCHWPGCEKQVPPAMWGCGPHWSALPSVLRRRIWDAYRPGQEITKTPSGAYLEAAAAVEKWVREGQSPTPQARPAMFRQGKLETPVTFESVRDAITWEQKNVVVFGVEHPQPRLTGWYGDVGYTYSGLRLEPRPMPDLLRGVMAAISEIAGEAFNSVLCNLYRNGQDRIGWHSDDETPFGPDPVIASVSFGAARRFQLRKKSTGETREVRLGEGDYLIMGRGCQRLYQHGIPRELKVKEPRISLTFRRVI